VDEEGRCSDDNTCGSKGETEKEVGAFARKEGDGAKDDGDLQKSFTEIVTGGLMLGVIDFLFEVAGFVLLFDQFGLPLFDMCLVFLHLGRDCGCVAAGLQGKEIEVDG